MVRQRPRSSRGLRSDGRGDAELVEVQRYLETTTSNNEHDGLKYGHKRRDCEVTKSVPIIGC